MAVFGNIELCLLRKGLSNLSILIKTKCTYKICHQSLLCTEEPLSVRLVCLSEIGSMFVISKSFGNIIHFNNFSKFSQ